MKELLGVFKNVKGSISSKRVCGIAGWLVIISCYAYCSFTGKEIPSMGELIAGCVTLLGVDSVTSIFKNNDVE